MLSRENRRVYPSIPTCRVDQGTVKGGLEKELGVIEGEGEIVPQGSHESKDRGRSAEYSRTDSDQESDGEVERVDGGRFLVPSLRAHSPGLMRVTYLVPY